MLRSLVLPQGTLAHCTTNEKNSLIWREFHTGEGQRCQVGKKKEMEGERDEIKREMKKEKKSRIKKEM